MDQYNCVMFALDLIGCLEEPCRPLGHFYADSAFPRFLIEREIINQVDGEPSEGDLAVYFEGGEIRHVGKVCGAGRIMSKWGIGNLYEHAPFEVPKSYGEEIRYFTAPNSDDTYDLLKEFLGV